MPKISGNDFEKKILSFEKSHEFRTFWLGLVLSSKMEKGLTPEERLSMKSEIKRELGRKLERAWAKKKILAVHDGPDVLFTLDHHSGRLKLAIKPLLVYGRYMKPSRKIPQSKWPCKRCSGAGCPHCGGKGAMYTETVEGFLGNALVAESGAKATKMHAVGREDIDARMLSPGRPFILELVEPKKRSIDLARAREEANAAGKGKASFSRLRFATKKELDKINSAQSDKTYRVQVKCARIITEADLKKLKKLKGRLISQQTPKRVLHRRADLLRKRRIRSLLVKRTGKDSFELEVRAESGTYIKEFVSGDGGRTKPSVASVLGCFCEPSHLDVARVWFSLR